MIFLRKPDIKLGKWKFYQVKLEDKTVFNNYLKASQWPVNLWSANFPFIWAFGQSPQRKLLWRIIDGLLVTFVLNKDNILSLLCLPFGSGNIDTLINVLYKSMSYCKDWNGKKGPKTRLRTINSEQLEYLQTSSSFNDLFKIKQLRGLERHYSTPELIALQGKKFESLRKTLNRFYRKYPKIELKEYIPAYYKDILVFNEEWEKKARNKYSTIFDRIYFKEILKNQRELDMLVLVAFYDNKVVGVNLSNLAPKAEGWGCICKSNKEFEGLNEALVLAMVKKIYALNNSSKYLNVGSDMGNKGLMQFKEKFRPVKNLERYRLYIK